MRGRGAPRRAVGLGNHSFAVSRPGLHCGRAGGLVAARGGPARGCPGSRPRPPAPAGSSQGPTPSHPASSPRWRASGASVDFASPNLYSSLFWGLSVSPSSLLNGFRPSRVLGSLPAFCAVSYQSLPTALSSALPRSCCCPALPRRS